MSEERGDDRVRREPEIRENFARKDDKTKDDRVVNIDHRVVKRDDRAGEVREDYTRRRPSEGEKKKNK